jgi:hypothetical protein
MSLLDDKYRMDLDGSANSKLSSDRAPGSARNKSRRNPSDYERLLTNIPVSAAEPREK